MTQTTSSTSVVTLTINDISVTVPKGTTVYQAAQHLKIDIPIFCYMDRMPPFGACRVCLVEVEKMSKLQTSCTLEATEGMVVKTMSQMAIKGREEILEFLLINHPLDCPICDRGGECPLQDQAYDHGPGLSRFFEEKRRFKKPLPLGPVLMLDRERCIVCARCTRFGDLVAGDHALEFIERGYRTEVGTPGGKPVESKFIGNTIMICPVGALTSQVYRFRARPWDNDSTNSTCTLCPVGCSMILDSRDGEIMRTRTQENKNINDIWMCDKGWFGYEFSSSNDRLDKPLIRKYGKLEIASWDEAISLIAKKIQEAKCNGKLAGWGGNPLTTEENYLFQRLMRVGAGTNHIDHRIGMPILNQAEEVLSAGMEIAIGDCEKLSHVLLLGLDLTEEFPVIWLRLKQAISCGAVVNFMGHFAPEIAPHLQETILHPPGKELSMLKMHLPSFLQSIKNDTKASIFIGRQYLNSTQRQTILAEILQQCQNISGISINVMEGRGNSYGASLAGMRPDRGPLNVSLNNQGLNAIQVIETARMSGWDYLHVAGANPAKKYPSKIWNEMRNKLKFLVVQDIFLTETAQQADVVLPAYCFVEKGGHFVNIAGDIQELLPGKELPQGIQSDAEIFMHIGQKLNIEMKVYPEFMEKIQQHSHAIRPPKMNIPSSQSTSIQIPADELAATFSYELFDHGVRMNHNPHVIKLAKDPGVRINPQEATKRQLQDKDEISINANGNTIVGKVKVDDKVAEGTAVLPLGFPELPVHELSMNLVNGLAVKISKK